MEISVIIFRMLITFIFAIIFGFQRQRAHKPIGFGTFTFVSVGSCGLAIAGLEFGMGNPLPILGAIVTGIGFLGAGALIKTSDKIFGFTTAASIWVFAIFGLLIGVGYFLVGGLVYLSVWAVILIDGFLKKRGVGSYQKRILFEVKQKNSKEFTALLRNFNRVKMISIEYDKKRKTEKFEYLVECNGKKLREIINLINQVNWVVSYRIE
ncbi:MAG: MgtC/SapB family protein [Nanoarchaeota archaeon]|nr:MgtC/SapB family protein [Nanoarchaeota archaeon]